MPIGNHIVDVAPRRSTPSVSGADLTSLHRSDAEALGFENTGGDGCALERTLRRRSRDTEDDQRASNRRPTNWVGDWVLVDDQEPPLGSHVGTPRFGFLHHGIYVGGGYVVHYAGYVLGLHRGPVELIEVGRFVDGRPLWVTSNAKSIFGCSEVIRRAYSRIGENRYRLFTNNCEHFCE
jgi:hypothetical protein